VTGIDAHGRPPVRSAPLPGSAGRKARRTDAVVLRSLLDVIADFDQFAEASLELVAWEPSIPESAVSAAWWRAIADGLPERSGTDEVHGEETWRLTTRGIAHARVQRSSVGAGDQTAGYWCKVVVRRPAGRDPRRVTDRVVRLTLGGFRRSSQQ
jgi:hypothetical protein